MGVQGGGLALHGGSGGGMRVQVAVHEGSGSLAWGFRAGAWPCMGVQGGGLGLHEGSGGRA